MGQPGIKVHSRYFKNSKQFNMLTGQCVCVCVCVCVCWRELEGHAAQRKAKAVCYTKEFELYPKGCVGEL